MKPRKKRQLKGLTPEQTKVLGYIIRKPRTTYKQLVEIDQIAANKTVSASLKKFVRERLIEIKEREKVVRGKGTAYYGLTFQGLFYSLYYDLINPTEARDVRLNHGLDFSENSLKNDIVEEMEKEYPEEYYSIAQKFLIYAPDYVTPYFIDSLAGIVFMHHYELEGPSFTERLIQRGITIENSDYVIFEQKLNYIRPLLKKFYEK